jgi:hypothetical protein
MEDSDYQGITPVIVEGINSNMRWFLLQYLPHQCRLKKEVGPTNRLMHFNVRSDALSRSLCVVSPHFSASCDRLLFSSTAHIL